ncbi:MAG: hypothetical protein ACREUS_03310 [Burkholderiales bacterium]
METPPTVPELVKFYSYLSEKGLMNERTAYARSQAAQQVLSVLDEDEKQSLAKLDRDIVFRRFVNKNGQRFTPDSLQTYKQRFNSALDEFLRYAKDPSAYTPPASGTRERARTSAAAPAPTASRGTSGKHVAPVVPHGLLAYPLPLPSGTVAQLLLPPTITQADADRINALVSAMVKALVTAEETV